jgi:hypothetical protein
MPLDVALISIKEAPGGLTGYTMVISPGHNQPGWTYGLGGTMRDLLPFKGYWVVMENADTLYGFSTTPIAASSCLPGAIPLTASSAAPTFPHAFYGNVTISGTPAPNGTVVEARGEGVLTDIEDNPITITEAGKYGAPGGFDPKLVVQGNITDGTNLTFYVNNVAAQCYDAQAGGEWLDSYPFKSSNVTVLELKVTGATLEGHVNFVGRGSAPDGRWIEDFVVRFFQDGNETPWSPINATTNNTGIFNITGILPGTYDIGIKNWTCLSALMPNVVLNANVTTYVYFGTIRVGDANNNDYITISDRTLLYGGWGTSDGDPGWNANCDFNNDGYLTISDRTLLYGNWNEKGDLAL